MNLEEFAEKALNVPFMEKGRDWTGWDCWGLVYVAYRDVFGVELPLYTGEYSSTRRRRELRDLISREKITWKRVDVARAGDVVVARMLGQFCHVGLMLSHDEVIHVGSVAQVGRESITRGVWIGQVEGLYRYAA